MPALLFDTLAQENLESLLAWRFLLAFGGGSLICFVAVFLFGAGRATRKDYKRRIEEELHRFERFQLAE